jgi:glycosyltransferase involved in cell wall biosynthesis
MKIIFFTRSNLYTFGGGDKMQILKTKEGLEKLGHEVTIATNFVGDLSPYDVVHLFNMQISPPSLVAYTLQAQKYGKPIALSTIYWNPSEWFSHRPRIATKKRRKSLTEIYSFMVGGLSVWKFVSLFVTNSLVRKWFITLLATRSQDAAAAPLKRWMMANVDIILPNGEKEREQVEADFGKAKRALFVPNGVDDDFKDVSAAEFTKKYGVKDFVLTAGRIESRKNTLELAEAVTELGLPFVVIGNDQAEPEYAEAVKQAAPDALFIPEIDYQDLGSAYKAAKVHAMISWFETPGLSSLEAGMAGCNIVSTELGTTTEYFDDYAWYCTPKKPESIKAALEAAYKAPKSDKLRHHLLKNFTWDVTAKVTLDGYKQIVTKKS